MLKVTNNLYAVTLYVGLVTSKHVYKHNLILNTKHIINLKNYQIKFQIPHKLY